MRTEERNRFRELDLDPDVRAILTRMRDAEGLPDERAERILEAVMAVAHNERRPLDPLAGARLAWFRIKIDPLGTVGFGAALAMVGALMTFVSVRTGHPPSAPAALWALIAPWMAFGLMGRTHHLGRGALLYMARVAPVDAATVRLWQGFFVGVVEAALVAVLSLLVTRHMGAFLWSWFLPFALAGGVAVWLPTLVRPWWAGVLRLAVAGGNTILMSVMWAAEGAASLPEVRLLAVPWPVTIGLAVLVASSGVWATRRRVAAT